MSIEQVYSFIFSLVGRINYDADDFVLHETEYSMTMVFRSNEISDDKVDVKWMVPHANRTENFRYANRLWVPVFLLPDERIQGRLMIGRTYTGRSGLFMKVTTVPINKYQEAIEFTMNEDGITYLLQNCNIVKGMVLSAQYEVRQRGGYNTLFPVSPSV